MPFGKQCVHAAAAAVRVVSGGILKAAEKLGLPVSECVVFEDALVGIRTAKKAGFTVVAIRDPNAYWEAEEIRGLCDRYLTRYEDLLEG